MFSLRQWQKILVKDEQLIVQASTTDGLDGHTAPSIGMSYVYSNFPELSTEFQIGDHENLVLCALNTETDQRRRGNQPINRKQIVEYLQQKSIQNVSLQGKEYFKSLPKYKFVISPEGNGIDCHRHYEALMAGCIPIVEDSFLIRCKYGDVPFLFTTDYSEITPEYLAKKYEEMIDKVWDFRKLFLSYWSIEEQILIRYRGNFWCMRFANNNWYKDTNILVQTPPSSRQFVYTLELNKRDIKTTL
jgi:hypothetical protein